METFLNGSSKETLSKKDPRKHSYFLKLDDSGVSVYLRMRSTVLALAWAGASSFIPSNKGWWMQVNPRS